MCRFRDRRQFGRQNLKVFRCSDPRRLATSMSSIRGHVSSCVFQPGLTSSVRLRSSSICISRSSRLLRSCRISLALLDFLQRLHSAVQRMPMVSSELGVCAFERRVSVGFWLLDPIPVSLLRLVVLRRVLGFGHCDGMAWMMEAVEMSRDLDCWRYLS